MFSRWTRKQRESATNLHTGDSEGHITVASGGPRQSTTTSESRTHRTPATSLGTLPSHVPVLIVGSGFAGLGAAIRLDKAGHGDFLVIERAAEVGGTWRDNTYPGAACDVPSHLYSFSFARNPDWTRAYSSQPEIQRYLRSTAQDSGTLDRHVFDCELLSARWLDEHQQWTVTTSQGTISCSILVTAFGGLCEPRMPDIKGIDQFGGPIIHTARWDSSVDLNGKRVAVIGTGASAIQLIPEIASRVAHLDVYQRTAPWVLPRGNPSYENGRSGEIAVPAGHPTGTDLHAVRHHQRRFLFRATAAGRPEDSGTTSIARVRSRTAICGDG